MSGALCMFEEGHGNLPASIDLAKPTKARASLAPTRGREVFTLPHGSVKTPSLICFLPSMLKERFCVPLAFYR